MPPERTPPGAVITGCAGLSLSADESRLFADTDPFGFVLFARNIDSPGQVRALTDAMRAAVGRADAPVLIDQEGGRVARLRPPHWRHPPPAARFGEMARRDPDAAATAAELNSQLIAAELRALGITVDCVPVLDVPGPGMHEVIGDRVYAETPGLVARLGRAACDGLLAGGVLPVIKHMPGHGRARTDSHAELPVVDAPRAELEAVDFAPFRALADMPWGMTAHVVYDAIDPDQPATTSAAVIEEVIRGWMGFDGLLLSDDLCMSALSGTPGARARAALEAGCDVALHCNGTFEEMVAVAGAAGSMSEVAQTRARRAPVSGDVSAFDVSAFDVAAARSRLDELLGATAAG